MTTVLESWQPIYGDRTPISIDVSFHNYFRLADEITVNKLELTYTVHFLVYKMLLLIKTHE